MENNNREVQVVNDQSVVVVDNSAPYSLSEVKNQVNLIQHIMKEVMQDGQHYGLVPGCGNKPSLFKSGAEKLSFTFKLRPIIGDKDIVVTPMDNGHREYSVHCHIYNMNGLELATGIGSASTMEKKFRFRKNFKTGAQEENPCIADVYNTVLKMAKKRAYVDGMLSATAASDIFTQDIEDLPDEMLGKPSQAHQKAPSKPVEAPSTPSVTVAPVEKPKATAPKVVTAIGNEASGLVSAIFPPKNPKGPTSFALNGEKVYYKSFAKDIIDQLTAAKENEVSVTIAFKVTSSGGYTNNIIESVSVQEGAGEKPMPEPMDDSEEAPW